MGLNIRLYFDVDTGNEPYQATVHEDHIGAVGVYFKEAGVYEILQTWDERQAHLFIEPLTKAVGDIHENWEKYYVLPVNKGLNKYSLLMSARSFLNHFLEACIRYPNARVRLLW